MADRVTIRTMRRRANHFLRCQSLDVLSRMVRTEPMKLAALALDPAYREFRIPKKNGKFRQIEDPVPPLKKVQRKLNEYLQAVYYQHRTPGAYGFTTSPTDDPEPRNILTNAQRHVGCKWMLNVDMQDFFHLISRERIEQLFQAPLLDFDESLSTALAGLCTYKERLPMGAPTSPILSNLIAIPLDQDLQDYADDRGWAYTRFADDITFSSQTPIEQGHIDEINEWVQAYDLKLNPSKIKLFDDQNTAKEVTGLHIGKEEVGLTSEYLASLQQAIGKFGEVIDAQFGTASGQYQRTEWVEELEAKVRGKLEFARQILPEEDELLIDLEMAFEKAQEPPEQYGPLNWLDFGYSFFTLKQ